MGTISQLIATHLNATQAGAALAGPLVTLGGTQVADTFRAIELWKDLRRIDGELTKAGFLDAAQRELRLDFDDLVVFDLMTNSEVQRIPGCL